MNNRYKIIITQERYTWSVDNTSDIEIALVLKDFYKSFYDNVRIIDTAIKG